MRSRKTKSLLLLALTPAIAWVAPLLAADPDPAATQPAAATMQAPATTQSGDDISLNFQNTPLDVVLEHLSQVAGFTIIKDVQVDTRVSVMSMHPVTAQYAVTLLDAVLKNSGFTAVQEGRTLRIVARDKAKKMNVPVQFGADPAEIEASDKLITQVMPIKNIDAVKLRDDLRPLIGPEADVAANNGSNSIVITDVSSNIKRVATIIAALDHRETARSDIRVIQLKNASASSAARLILAIFHPEDERGRGQPQQQKPPPPAEEKAAVGNGLDQALKGTVKITAAADDRTNTVIVAGPTETLKFIEDMLQRLDANPATIVTIKSYHLKTADADEASRVIMSVFGSEGPGTQIHGLGDQPLRGRISAVPEYRTNTVVVTAPASVMTVIEDLIKELESNPSGEQKIKSFQLKFADAAATAAALESSLDPSGGRRRRGPGLLERINVTPDPKTNSIIVSGPADALRDAEKIIADLDKNPAMDTPTQFFHLKMADVGTASKIINGFFSPSGDPARKNPNERNPVNVQIDDRSNTLIVHAPPEAMKVAEQIIKEIESQPWLQYDVHSYALTFADADATAKLITSLFASDAGAQAAKPPTLRTYVIASADTRTNSVVVTAPPENLKAVDALIKLLDSNPGTGSDMKVFQLQYADAESAAKLIQSMFPQPGLGVGYGPQSRGGGQINQLLLHMPLVITSADDRTNTLVVTAPADVLKVVEALVHQLDANPASKQTFFIYRLSNGKSADMANVMNQLFGANVGSSSRTTSSTSGQNQGFGTGQGVGRGNAGGRSGFGGGQSGLGLGGGMGGGGFGGRGAAGGLGGFAGGAFGAGSSGSSSTSSLSAATAQMANALAGQVLVVADPDTNSLLVTTASRYETQVRQIIAELDKAVPQVLIKVLVAEVTHDNSADFGTDFSILNTRPNGNGQSFGQTFGQPGTGLVVNFLENNLNATLHALAQQNKLDVLSRPYILASDNQEASILVGQQVPIVTSNTITALGQVVSNYRYESVGIILDVTPHINPDGLVTLDVAPEISQLTAQTVSVGPGVNAPVIADRSAESRVSIRDGNTIVIGGLMQDQKTLTVNKVPLLGDIPILGYLFSRTQVDKTKTELLIFLTPHVAQQPENLVPMSKEETKATQLTPNAVVPGTFKEHLEGMKRGDMTSPSTTQPATHPNITEIKSDESTTQPATQTLHLPIR